MSVRVMEHRDWIQKGEWDSIDHASQVKTQIIQGDFYNQSCAAHFTLALPSLRMVEHVSHISAETIYL